MMKKYIVKVLLWVSILIGVISNFSLANLFLMIQQLASGLANSLVPIRYVYKGNKFVWAFFITNVEDETQQVCIDNGSFSQCKVCHKKLYWYYWSHGHRILPYPLTEKDRNFLKAVSAAVNADFYSNLSVNGGLYTACDGEPESVYGYIDYKYAWNTLFKIFAGLEVSDKFVPNNSFATNLQFVQWYNLVGLITDSIAGVGVVGIKSNKIDPCVNTFISRANNTGIVNFVSIDTGWNVVVDMWSSSCDWSMTGGFVWNQVANVLAFRWIYSLTDSTYESIKDLFVSNVGREQWTSVQYSIYADKSTFSSTMNYLRKKAEYLCRWKWKKYDWVNWNDDIVCIDIGWWTWKVYTKSGKNPYVVWKTIIARNWNLIISGDSITDNNYINIFVDRGNLIIDIDDLLPTDGDGQHNPTNAVTSWVHINGDLIVNWLLLGPNNPEFNHKLYIHGRVMFLNTIGEPTNKRVEFVNYIVGENALWNTLDGDFSDDKKFIDLNKVFARRCDFASGIWSDGVRCWDENDKYSLYSIIIDYRRWLNSLFR